MNKPISYLARYHEEENTFHEINEINFIKKHIKTTRDFEGNGFVHLVPNEELYIIKNDNKTGYKISIQIKITYKGKRVQTKIKLKKIKLDKTKKEIIINNKTKSFITDIDYDATRLIHIILNSIESTKEKQNNFKEYYEEPFRFFENAKIKVPINPKLKPTNISQKDISEKLNKYTENELISIFQNAESNQFLKPSLINVMRNFVKNLKNIISSSGSERQLEQILVDNKSILALLVPYLDLDTEIFPQEVLEDDYFQKKNIVDLITKKGFCQVVELKKDQKLMVDEKANYKNPSSHLSKAVQQAENYLRRIQLDIQKTRKKVYDFPTKTVVIIGHKSNEISTLNEEQTKVWHYSFGLYKDSLKNTFVITWDELLERAEHMLNLLSK